MSMEGVRHLRFEAREGGIGLLTIDRPPVNALGRELVEDLNTACAFLEADAGTRVLVLAAEGKAFCAGADLKERQTMSEEDVRAWVPYLSGTFTRISRLPMPTVACLQGVAAGGGVELALGCDLRVAEEPVTIGLRETSLAIIPGAGGTQRLPRLIGASRAMSWIPWPRPAGGSTRRSTWRGRWRRTAPWRCARPRRRSWRVWSCRWIGRSRRS